MNPIITLLVTVLPIVAAAAALVLNNESAVNTMSSPQTQQTQQTQHVTEKIESKPERNSPVNARQESPLETPPKPISESKQNMPQELPQEPATEVMTVNDSIEQVVTPQKTHPSIEISPLVVEPGEVLMVSGRMFLEDSSLAIVFGNNELASTISDSDGSMTTVLEIPRALTDGVYTLKIYDTASGTATHRVIVRTPAVKIPEPELEMQPVAQSEVPQVVDIPDADDNYAPTSNVIIKGEQSCYTRFDVEHCWYHDYAPVAEFVASDDRSGVKHVSVLYNGQFYLQPGSSLTLNRYSPMQRGNVSFTYFAVDNAGNAEKPKTVSIMVDALAPDLYVRKIHTDTIDNARIGNCKIEQHSNPNCVVIPARVKETVTFELLLSDLVSGVNATYYRILEPLDANYDQIPWTLLQQGTSQVPILNVKFDEHGNYFVQLKTTDFAGNESKVQTFYVKVTPNI